MAPKLEDEVIAGALEHWATVNLTELLRILDETGLTIVENQKTSLQGRRKLAEKTKEFRGVSDTEKVKAFKPLLRAYQSEIDELTRRMKYAETAFLSLFKTLSDAPDPKPFMENLLDERKSGTDIEQMAAELTGAKQKIEALTDENKRFKQQSQNADEMQKKIEAFEKNFDEIVAKREAEIREETEGLVAHLKTREGDLQNQLSAANRTLAMRDQQSEDSETLQTQSDADRELIAKLADHEILISDLDRANARVADLQSQNSALRAEIDAMCSGDSASGVIAEFRRREEELEDEAARLVGEVERAESELHKTQASADRKTTVLEGEVAAKGEEITRLRAELARRADYDEIKRDLDIIKSVEFGDWDGDDNDKDEPAANGTQSLERLLVARNKALETKLTGVRNELADSTTQLAETQARLAEIESQFSEKSQLAQRLEEDLLRVEQGNAQTCKTDKKTGNIELQTMGDTSNGDEILQIVTGQRDRFRQRNMELEEEVRSQTVLVGDAQRQMEQTKQDNLRLYEEIRYLRNYAAATSSSSTAGNGDMVINVPSKYSSSSKRAMVDVDTGVGAKYKGMYEESLNPFNVFHRNEASRKVRDMTLIDRLVYMVSNAILGNHKARIALVVYLIVLHLLVVVTLYRSSVIADDVAHHDPVQIFDPTAI